MKINTYLKLSTLCISGVLFVQNVFGQQDPYMTHYMYNRLQFNPAAAGESNKWCVTGLSHFQWRGYRDQTAEYQTPNSSVQGDIVAPNTQMFSFSVPLGKYNKTTGTSKYFGGFGLMVYKDRLGYEDNTSIRGAFNYRISLDGNGSSFINVGIDAGMLQKKLDGTKLIAFNPIDPYIPNSQVGDSKLSLGFGALYKNTAKNNLYAGISFTNMVPQTYAYGPSQLVTTETARHLYLMGGVEMPSFLGNPSFVLKPNALVKYKADLQIDASALLEYNDQLEGGLAYRTKTDALSILLGYYVSENFRIGYSFDLTLSNIQKVSNNTHELCVNYCWTIKLPPPPQPIYWLSPLWLDKDPSSE